MNTITDEDLKAIDNQIRSHPDGGDFELYVRLKEIAEWGIQYARQEVAELRKENEDLRKKNRILSECNARLASKSALSGTKETE